MKDICYLAGPMTGFPRFNFDAFDIARDQLESEGWTVISPADLDRQHGFDPDNPPPITPSLLREAVMREMAVIMESDAVVLLPGWEREYSGTPPSPRDWRPLHQDLERAAAAPVPSPEALIAVASDAFREELASVNPMM